MVTLEQVRYEAAGEVFPVAALEDCETALILFAAAFHGRQDAIWMADEGLTGTCVDSDAEKLGAMVLAYPQGWEYVVGDAYVYAQQTRRRWDVVSVDAYTNQFQRAADQLELWCSRANRSVILGTGVATKVEPPAGWQVTDVLQRSMYQGGVFWTVLERC
jgi:hypothetical protein